MTLFLVAIAAFTSTLLGGLFALKFKDKLHLILGFSAGSVLGVAFFDLLPESLELGSPTFELSTITSVVALGFILFMILDRTISLHTDENRPARGKLGAGSLSVHSFIDGMAVGLAFQVSEAVGIIVAIAVLTHGFSDGINTVNLILKNGGTKHAALKWVILDATAPVLGIIATLFFSLAGTTLGLILAMFCGFFLYIGATDLLPESHHNHPSRWTTLTTILGVLVLYIAIKLANL